MLLIFNKCKILSKPSQQSKIPCIIRIKISVSYTHLTLPTIRLV